MEFSYQAYASLVDRVRTGGYAVEDYHTWENSPRCVILRHDVDTCLEQAVRMAELEHALGIRSTYFVLLTSNLYNVASAASRAALHRIQDLGHEIGLHFDEAAYGELTPARCVAEILRERDALSLLLGTPITTVSMHRPSKATLEGNLQIPGMINSYSEEFFHGFKYLSDSRRRWREPVEDIVQAGIHDRLHILTHAFWYAEEERTMGDTIRDFVSDAKRERYRQMSENITDLDSVIRWEDI